MQKHILFKRIAVIGSRSITDKYYVWTHLDTIFNGDILISGGCKGPDKFAEEWAIHNKVPIKIFLPNWDKYGKKAGMLRNSDIVSNCTILIAFWDGISKGTLDSINKAKASNKKIIVIEGKNDC